MKLNLETMQSSVAWVDAVSGHIDKQLFLPTPWQRMSLRHMSPLPGERVLVAGQWQGPNGVAAPLLWRAGTTDPTLEPFAAHIGDEAPMRGYVSSVASDRSERFVVSTSPRGNVAIAWDARYGRMLATTQMPDVSGISSMLTRGVFLASQGNGKLAMIDPVREPNAPRQLIPAADRYWDNHLASQ